MSNKDDLGDRMKLYYENISRISLTRRTPVILRVDGKAFHTFTRGFDRPFSDLLSSSVDETMLKLCANIQGAKFGYCQSDEISILITDYDTLNTDAWFGYGIQKMVSIAASMTSVFFNKIISSKLFALTATHQLDSDRASQIYARLEEGPFFDARVFSIPKEEVCNYFIWRQQDATRNSIEMAGRAYFSHRQLDRKTTGMIQDMLMTQKGVNWNNYPTRYKRGGACSRQLITDDNFPDPRNPGQEITVTRRKWVCDSDMPILTQDRNYVEQWI